MIEAQSFRLVAVLVLTLNLASCGKKSRVWYG